MAIASPILCIVGNEDEASQFRTALDSLRISNPINCVTGAAEAMSILELAVQRRDGPPVLVFLSLAAPEANRLAAWFEAHPQDRPAGLIAMTGFQDVRPIVQAYHLGVTAFLEWPLKTEDVRNALNTNRDLAIDDTDGKLTVRVDSK
jgi:AmiR/NasT family two-component response regulator